MADLENLLVKTSRTFALAIPMLPEPTVREVRVAYLLLRIADTFEDSTHWSGAERVEALRAFRGLLRPGPADGAARLAARWTAVPPVDHEGYLELLGATPAVLEALTSLGDEAQGIVRRHVDRSAAGMIPYAGREGVLELSGVEELRDYCYVVAGIVGELLTELFVAGWASLAPHQETLARHARHFGEGLQLTNILRDADGDRREGRAYLPHRVPRGEVFAIARDDLDQAERYVDALAAGGAPSGVLAFTALPLLLARETLDRVETQGPGAKLTRAEVGDLVARTLGAIQRGESVLRAVENQRADDPR